MSRRRRLGVARVILGLAAAAATPVLGNAGTDYSLSPSRVLYAAERAAGKPAEIHLYPRFGETTAQGHGFGWRGMPVWKGDVLHFLDQHCTR